MIFHDLPPGFRRPPLKDLPKTREGWRRLVVRYAILAFVLCIFVAAVDYMFLGGADRFGLLGAILPSSKERSDLSLEQIEARIDAILARGGDGLSTRRFRAEGCLAIVSDDYGRETCPARGAGALWKRETVSDLTLLLTDPERVSILSLKESPFPDMVEATVYVRKDAARALRGAYERIRTPAQSAPGRRNDVTRIEALREALKDAPADRLFERKAERLHFCRGDVLTVPADPIAARFVVDRTEADALISLLNAYALRACPPDPSLGDDPGRRDRRPPRKRPVSVLP